MISSVIFTEIQEAFIIGGGINLIYVVGGGHFLTLRYWRVWMFYYFCLRGGTHTCRINERSRINGGGSNIAIFDKSGPNEKRGGSLSYISIEIEKKVRKLMNRGS